MVKVTSLLSKAGSVIGFSFGASALTEREIWCIKGLYRLKLVSSENNPGFKGLQMTHHNITETQVHYIYKHTVLSVVVHVLMCAIIFSLSLQL